MVFPPRKYNLPYHATPCRTMPHQTSPNLTRLIIPDQTPPHPNLPCLNRRAIPHQIRPCLTRTSPYLNRQAEPDPTSPNRTSPDLTLTALPYQAASNRNTRLTKPQPPHHAAPDPALPDPNRQAIPNLISTQHAATVSPNLTEPHLNEPRPTLP